MASPSSSLHAAFTKIADLGPCCCQVNAIVKVVSCEVKLQCLGQRQHPRRFVEVLVGDETGTALLRAEHALAGACVVGATIVLRSARVELFDGKLRLELGRWSRLTRVGDAAFSVPPSAVCTDVSATAHAMVAC